MYRRLCMQQKVVCTSYCCVYFILILSLTFSLTLRPKFSYSETRPANVRVLNFVFVKDKPKILITIFKKTKICRFLDVSVTAHALGGVSGVASFITTHERLQ